MKIRILTLWVIILSSSFLISCGKQKLLKQLETFTSEEVVVPDGIRQMIGWQDTIILNTDIGLARLIVYVDPVTCSSCRLKLMFEYTDVIDFHEEAGEAFVPLFIFSPPQANVDEVIRTLETTQFNYPVFIDEHQAFPAANPHIPADNRFHTFLIDKNGKVILVGDPVNNPQLWELYKTTITTLIENDGVMPEPETK